MCTEHAAGRVPETIRTLWKKIKTAAHAENRTKFLDSAATVLFLLWRSESKVRMIHYKRHNRQCPRDQGV